MDIYWERTDLLAFRLHCFTLRCLNYLCSFPVWCLGQDVNSIVSVPEHCFFLYFVLIYLLSKVPQCIAFLQMVHVSLIQTSIYYQDLFYYVTIEKSYTTHQTVYTYLVFYLLNVEGGRSNNQIQLNQYSHLDHKSWRKFPISHSQWHAC